MELPNGEGPITTRRVSEGPITTRSVSEGPITTRRVSEGRRIPRLRVGLGLNHQTQAAGRGDDLAISEFAGKGSIIPIASKPGE